MRCPWCLREGLAGAEECAGCGRPWYFEGKAITRAEVAAFQARRELRLRLPAVLKVGSAVLIVIAILGWAAFPVLILSGPVLTAVHMVALRLTLGRIARKALRPKRRFLFRWTTRLALVLVCLPTFGLLGLPVWGGVIALLSFNLSTLGVYLYARWTLGRQLEARPLILLEKAALWAVTGIALCVVAVLLLSGIGFGFLWKAI